MKIDIEHEGIDIIVDGQQVLRIRQVSDDKVVNLFLYPEKKGTIIKSVMSEEDNDSKCTHELLVERE